MRNYRCCLSKEYRSFYLTVIIVILTSTIWLFFNLFAGHEATTMCPTKRFLHFPCPGCGLTRAIVSLMQGDLQSALYFNANSIILLPIFVTGTLLLMSDIIFNSTLTYKCYNKINGYINNRYFIAAFIVFEMIIEYHHIMNGI